MLPLQWRQVDLIAGVIRLEPGTTKNDEGRVLPFAALPALASVMRRPRDHTDAVERTTSQIIPWVFHRNGRRIKTFKGAWDAACAIAGLDGRIPHAFRRTAVRNLERAGVPRSVAMRITGHKTESVYRRYAIVSEADISEGMAKARSAPRADVSTIYSLDLGSAWACPVDIHLHGVEPWRRAKAADRQRCQDNPSTEVRPPQDGPDPGDRARDHPGCHR